MLRSPNQEGKKDGKEDNSVVNITTTDDINTTTLYSWFPISLELNIESKLNITFPRRSFIHSTLFILEPLTV